MPERNIGRAELLAAIVLYETKPWESVAFLTVTAAARSAGENISPPAVLLYDNTLSSAPPEDIPEGVTYQRALCNEGVAGAYNFALDFARQNGFDWILVLDQDTQVPQDYLQRLLSIVNRLGGVTDVGAVVPHLCQGEKVLSPVRIRPWGVSYFPPSSAGFGVGEVHAFNSGSLFRRSALEQIGGFDDRFWLDYQDASVYRRLYQCGKRVYIADGLTLEHELSLISDQPMRPARFQNYLLAESAYYDMNRGNLAGLVLTGKTLRRFCQSLVKKRGPEIWRLAWAGLLRRLLRSRRARIEEWRRDLSERMPGAEDAWERRSNGERPRISVCMAAYNGGLYVTQQLESILPQLGADDEVVIVDDASSDQTVEKILAVGDPRIRLLRHENNCGVLRTFEDALRAAQGRILFLSDQDDLWDPHKVATILEAFRTNPRVSLVATDNALIDSSGSLISNSYFENRGPFRQGLWANLIRNRYGGCTMAFRAEILSEVLPLPHGYEVLHDIWIGVRNSLSGGQALYIPKPLVLNRRHGATATGRSRLSVGRRLRLRAHLLLSLAAFEVRKALI
ncbi:MAG: glycosyltransferase [Acidobacteriota bacterium]